MFRVRLHFILLGTAAFVVDRAFLTEPPPPYFGRPGDVGVNLTADAPLTLRFLELTDTASLHTVDRLLDDLARPLPVIASAREQPARGRLPDHVQHTATTLRSPFLQLPHR